MRTNRYIIFLTILITVVQFTSNAQNGPPWVKYNVGYNYILRGIDFPSNQNNIGFTAGESLTSITDSLPGGQSFPAAGAGSIKPPMAEQRGPLLPASPTHRCMAVMFPATPII